MKKTITSVLAAATVVVVLAGSATDASAQRRSGAVAAGVLGGFVAGAIVGSAIANSQPNYGPAYVVQPGYAVYPSYVAAAPVGCPGGYWARQPRAYDRWGNVVSWSRPRFFCP